MIKLSYTKMFNQINKIRLIDNRNWYVIILMLIIVFIPSISFSQHQELSKEDTKMFKTGVTHSKKGEDDIALKYFLEVNKNAPTNIDNLYYITITYYERLEDYSNTYKYGTTLLNVLNDKLNSLNPSEDKRKHEKAFDLIDEIELYVLVAKSKVGITGNENDDTIDTEKVSEDTIKETEEILKEEPEADEATIQESRNEQVGDSFISNDISSTALIGFTTIISAGNFKDEIVSDVEKEYKRVKNEQKFDQKSYYDVLNDNSSKQLLFNKQNIENLHSLTESEEDLLGAIYNYNISLFQRDSIDQLIAKYTQRNFALKEEIESLNWYFEQFSYDQDTLIDDGYRGLKQEVFIGRYMIKKSLDNDMSKRLLNQITASVKEHKGFSNPQINSVVSLINSFNDDKYLYLVTRIADAYELSSDTGFGKSDNNLEVFSYQSGELKNIKTHQSFSFSDLGLKSNEIEIIQRMDQFANKNSQPGTNEANYLSSIAILQKNAAQRNYLLSEELVENEIIIDSLIVRINDFLILYKDLFYEMKETYSKKIHEINSYESYLVLIKEVDSKTASEQFAEMTREIVDLANENLIHSTIDLNRIVTYRDTTYQTNQIKFLRDTVILIPKINQYKILSLTKVKFDNSDDTYFALDIGFEISYSFPENVPANETVSYDTVQPNNPNQNKSGNNNQTVNMPPVVESYKVLSIEGVSILQDHNNKKWKVLEDNPSSYTSYMMFQEEEGWRLPTYNELRSIIAYLASNKNKLDQLGWANNGVIYLSSDSHYDNRNNEIYKGIKFNGSSYQNLDVQGGDEVYLIVVSE